MKKIQAFSNQLIVIEPWGLQTRKILRENQSYNFWFRKPTYKTIELLDPIIIEFDEEEFKSKDGAVFQLLIKFQILPRKLDEYPDVDPPFISLYVENKCEETLHKCLEPCINFVNGFSLYEIKEKVIGIPKEIDQNVFKNKIDDSEKKVENSTSDLIKSGADEQHEHKIEIEEPQGQNLEDALMLKGNSLIRELGFRILSCEYNVDLPPFSEIVSLKDEEKDDKEVEEDKKDIISTQVILNYYNLKRTLLEKEDISIKQSSKQIETQRKKLDSEMKGVQQEYSRIIASLDLDHQKEMNKCKNEHDKDMEILKNKSQEEITLIKNKHNAQIKDLDLKFQEEINKIESDHKQRLENYNQQNELKLKKMNNKYKSESVTINKKLIELEGQFKRAENEHRIKMDELEKDFQIKQDGIKREITKTKLSKESIEIEVAQRKRELDEIEFFIKKQNEQLKLANMVTIEEQGKIREKEIEKSLEGLKKEINVLQTESSEFAKQWNFDLEQLKLDKDLDREERRQKLASTLDEIHAEIVKTLVDKLPDIVGQAVKPAEKIDEIKIFKIDGAITGATNEEGDKVEKPLPIQIMDYILHAGLLLPILRELYLNTDLKKMVNLKDSTNFLKNNFPGLKKIVANFTSDKKIGNDVKKNSSTTKNNKNVKDKSDKKTK